MTQEAVADLMREQDELRDDEMIIHYDHPDAAQMRELIKLGGWYTGPWYHSYIVFSTADEPTAERQVLRAEIERMGSNAGFYLLYEWTPESVQAIQQRQRLERLYRED